MDPEQESENQSVQSVASANSEQLEGTHDGSEGEASTVTEVDSTVFTKAEDDRRAFEAELEGLSEEDKRILLTKFVNKFDSKSFKGFRIEIAERLRLTDKSDAELRSLCLGYRSDISKFRSRTQLLVRLSILASVALGLTCYRLRTLESAAEPESAEGCFQVCIKELENMVSTTLSE